MKIVRYRNKIGLKVLEVWFCKELKNINEKYDLIRIKGYKEKIANKKNNIQLSLINDLTGSEDELFANIKKNVKYEINRCYKENISSKIYDFKNGKFDKNLLNEFIKTYEKMYQEKGMKIRGPIKDIKRYIKSGGFILTIAFQGNKKLVYHAYISDEKNTRLLYSCSTFRSDSKEERNLIARANKFLHWEDMKYFKNCGVEVYDFGGISSFDNPNGIDKFKMSFGGDKIEYYNISYTNTKKGNYYCKLKNKMEEIL